MKTENGRSVRTRRRAVTLAGAVALVTGAIMGIPAPAGAAALACGSTISTSITLTADLNCSGDTTGNAITIGAAGVTVNLNGHKIVGPGPAASTDGIVDHQYNQVGIEGGAISGFSTSVNLEGTSSTDLSGATLANLAVTSSGTGVYTNYVYGVNVSRSSFNITGDAVSFNWASSSLATDNKVSTSGTAFNDCNGTNDTLSHNSITLLPTDSGGTGFYVMSTAKEVIRANNVSGRNAGPSSDGIVDWYSSGQLTTENVLNYVSTGIFESDEDGMVSYNRGYHDNLGIDEEGAIGISYTGNSFSGGNYGIWVYDPSGTQLTGNVTNHNAKAGVYIFVDNIYCSPCSARLVNNTAEYNARGLYSQIPTTGSGNYAAHNTVVNCHNVICASKPPSSGTRTLT